MRRVPIRRTDTEKVQVGGADDGIRRYYDQNLEMTVVKLMTGDCYTTGDSREMLVTILGSCISVCARDPIAGCGGMNHILLPGNKNKMHLTPDDVGYSTRFGAFAMEELFNGLFKLGGKRERMEVKIFGGGNVIKNSSMIGSKNIAFVLEYLKNEGYKVDAQDVGGKLPRRIHYFPDNGKVMMRALKRKDDMAIIDKESKYQTKVNQEKNKSDIDLF